MAVFFFFFGPYQCHLLRHILRHGNSESRIDFRCSGAKSENVDIVRGKCCEKYMKQYNKFGFPVYGFVILNLVFIALVCAIYSQIMIRPKLDQLLDQETASSTGNKLLIAQSCQLSIRLVLELFSSS